VWAERFLSSFIKILEERKDQIGKLTFDKDDDLAMDFVAAACNIRTYNFMVKDNPSNKLVYMSK